MSRDAGERARDFPPLPMAARGAPSPFFADPAVDALLGMVLELAREQWVTKSRLAALEHWAETQVTAASTPWGEGYAVPAETEARLAAERDAFVCKLLGPMERV